MDDAISPTAGSDRQRGWFTPLVLVAVVATFGLIVIGGVVRVTGSGLGCPDWPLCHGRIIPPMDFHTLIEYSHRLSASLVSVLVIAVGVLAWVKYRHHRPLLVLALTSVALLTLQVVLGGITVLTDLKGTVVTAHLGTAGALLAVLIVALIVSSQPRAYEAWDSAEQGRRVWWLAGSTSLGIYILTLLGAYVRGSGATYVCLTWPLCHGAFLPGGQLELIHMMHRLTVVLVGVLVAITIVKTWRYRRGRPWQGTLSGVLGTLFIAQVVAGAAMVLTDASPATQALHLSLGMATWGASIALTTVVWLGATSTTAIETLSPSRDGVLR